MTFRVAGAQLDLVVGDISGNEERIAQTMDWAERERAEWLLLPELALSGYPPEDLIYRADFLQANQEALLRLAGRSGDTATVLGTVEAVRGPSKGEEAERHQKRVANAAALLHRGKLVGTYHKVRLPNYGVFDERRHFVTGREADRVWTVHGYQAGISICEDIWVTGGPPQQQAAAGAELLLNINASPYHRGKVGEREEMLQRRAREAGSPLVYLNLVGGQDELVFDGGSMVITAQGETIHRSRLFKEDRFLVEIPAATERVPPPELTPLPSLEEELFSALCVGLNGYIDKNSFPGAVLGLSGGIDSALTAAIAATALNPERVWGVAMPSRYSSEHSLTDARALAYNLGIRYSEIPIDTIFQAQLEALEPCFRNTKPGVAEENLQARIRGTVLMALSNKFGPMVVATGNKSEMGVGYATLYGDMVGGFSVLKDVFKTKVYELARWFNRNQEIIPWSSIHKPPSAELAEDQQDSDSLPPYEMLDAILELYIEEDLDLATIIARGFSPPMVERVVGMVDHNEYKRRQSAPGVKVSTKALGKDRRLPITNRYRSSGG